MFLIVEGFDNTGKTSLINFLVKDYGPQGPSLVFHSSALKNQKQRLEEILEYTYSSNTPWPQWPHRIICDRISIVGEEVYGKYLRGFNQFGDSLDNVWYNFLKDFPKEAKIVFIWCNPANHEMGNKEEMEGVIEHQKELLLRYNEAMGITREVFEAFKILGYKDLKFIEFDYQSDPNYQNLHKLIYGKEESQ